MRTIKFRVWETNKHLGSKMSDPFSLIDVHNRKYVVTGFADEVIFMQFTGLLDKNGKEIYEGDILRNKLSFLKGQPVDKNNPTYKNYKVDWFNGNSLGYRIVNKRNIMPLTRNKIINADSEIIGNIYENPELLN